MCDGQSARTISSGLSDLADDDPRCCKTAIRSIPLLAYPFFTFPRLLDASWGADNDLIQCLLLPLGMAEKSPLEGRPSLTEKTRWPESGGLSLVLHCLLPARTV